MQGLEAEKHWVFHSAHAPSHGTFMTACPTPPVGCPRSSCGVVSVGVGRRVLGEVEAEGRATGYGERLEYDRVWKGIRKDGTRRVS